MSRAVDAIVDDIFNAVVDASFQHNYSEKLEVLRHLPGITEGFIGSA